MTGKPPATGELAPDERELIALIDTALRPEPADAAQPARFTRGLERRIAQRARLRRAALRGGALAACALAALLWSARARPPVAAAGPTSLLHAFADPRASGWEDSNEYLPDDYPLLASWPESDDDEP